MSIKIAVEDELIIMGLVTEMYISNKNFKKFSQNDVANSYKSLRNNIICRLNIGDEVDNIKCKLSMMNLWTRDTLPYALVEMDYCDVMRREHFDKRTKVLLQKMHDNQNDFHTF